MQHTPEGMPITRRIGTDMQAIEEEKPVLFDTQRRSCCIEARDRYLPPTKPAYLSILRIQCQEPHLRFALRSTSRKFFGEGGDEGKSIDGIALHSKRGRCKVLTPEHPPGCLLQRDQIEETSMRRRGVHAPIGDGEQVTTASLVLPEHFSIFGTQSEEGRTPLIGIVGLCQDQTLIDYHIAKTRPVVGHRKRQR